MNIELIKDLANTLGTTTTQIITSYAEWHFISAICYILLGLFVIQIGRIVNIESFKEECEAMVGYVIKYSLFFIGLMFLVVNVPDLFNAEAISIHQLIKDIRG